ncbi:piggyBac transposable element-derived protein 4-like isoform X2 [Clupea harengus]|uniref:PiggyBac transposable element-derived protein 4-like isoform X2 n=1 Tax=Clupea harengus TaxID=7950 RepID=A0A6P8F3C8_CLUHA|nr:piggyBac transposable element-derived protein 4-like isoform X2 [Clupea harengus]
MKVVKTVRTNVSTLNFDLTPLRIFVKTSKMKTCTRDQVIQMLPDSDEELDSLNECDSDWTSLDSSEEEEFEERLDRVPDLVSSEAPVTAPVPSPLQSPPPPGWRSKPAALADRWHDGSEEDVCPPQFPFCPERMPGPQLDFQKSYSPLEIFKLYFTPDVLQTLCTNTNKYAARKLAQGAKSLWPEVRLWTDVAPDEMLNYLSLVVYLGLVQVSPASDLWSKDSLFGFPFPASVMPGDRYEAITTYLHMSDPAADEVNDKLSGQPGYDGIFRVKPLLDDLVASCRAHYHPYQNLVIDQRLVATKARGQKQEIERTQYSNRGYKLFVLVDQSGYTCDFSAYEGMAESPSGNGLSFDAVVGLLKVPHLGTGYHVFMDNYYTSSQLFSHLHQLRIGACGTVWPDRVGFPRIAENDLSEAAARGDMRWVRDGPLLYVKWMDIRDVTMCSTIHKAYGGESMERRVRDGKTWTKRVFPLPDPVKEYDECMGAWVDVSDALAKYFSEGPRTNQWYTRLFLHFVDIVVVNSFVLAKDMAEAKKETPLNMESFRMALCEQLAEVGKEQAYNSSSEEDDGEEQAYNSSEEDDGEEQAYSSSEEDAGGATASLPPQPESHYNEPLQCLPLLICESQASRRCVLCNRRAIWKCEACDVPLCIIRGRVCYSLWHGAKA